MIAADAFFSARSTSGQSAGADAAGAASGTTRTVIEIDGNLPDATVTQLTRRLLVNPVIEAYKKDIDRTLIRENLKLTPERRLQKLQSFMEMVHGLRNAARRKA